MPRPSAFLRLIANLVFHTVFSNSELLEAKHSLQLHTDISINSCHKWHGSKDKNGYGVLRLKFRGRHIRVKAHRLCFYINNRFPYMDGKNVSHLCHDRGCINIDRL